MPNVSSIIPTQVNFSPISGNFGVWGGLFSTFECCLMGVRRKEDPWNSIGSGALTGAVLAARGGPSAAVSAAAIGAVLLALIEGVGIAITRMTAEQFKPGIFQINVASMWLVPDDLVFTHNLPIFGASIFRVLIL